MSATCRSSRHPAALSWGVWVLLWALAVQGCAGVVVQMLGPAHVHRSLQIQTTEPAPAAASPSWLGQLLAWHAAQREFVRTHGLFKHAEPESAGHRHDGLERHHHALGDASVVSLDGPAAHAEAAGDGAAQGAHGGLSLPWSPVADFVSFRSEPGSTAWPGTTTRRWSSAWVRLLERPPRA